MKVAHALLKPANDILVSCVSTFVNEIICSGQRFADDHGDFNCVNCRRSLTVVDNTVDLGDICD